MAFLWVIMKTQDDLQIGLEWNLDGIHFVDCASHISIGLILGLLEETLGAYTLMKLLRSYLGI